MKKIIFFIFLILFAPLCVMASEHHVYSININVHIEKNGVAYITELWEVKANNGKEWCKIFSNLEDVDLNDVSVLMDEDLAESENPENNKKANYKLTYVTGGAKFCFGYNDSEIHTFMLEYEIEDYVLDTEDGQVLYHVLTENVNADNFYADIVTYYDLPDNFELKSPGFSGDAYVKDGRIVFLDTAGLRDQYVTVLAKFPSGTFDSTSKNEELNTYDDALKHSEKGKYKYSDDVRGINRFTTVDLIFVLLSIFVVFLVIELIVRNVTGKSIFKQDRVKVLFKKFKILFRKMYKSIKNKISKKKV